LSRAFLAFAACVLPLAACHAAIGAPTATGVSVHSRSGQFVVVAPHDLPPPKPSPGDATNRALHITPEFTAVSCERIREGLLREFGMRDVFADGAARSKARITVALVPAAGPNPDLAYAATRYTDRWDYRLQIPARLEAETLVRGVLHVFLVAWANRVPGPSAAEIPAWLTEGLARHLQSVNPIELVVEQPAKSGNRLPLGVHLRESGRSDPLQLVRERLRLNPALTFTDLSMPASAMDSSSLEHYRDSAQVFVAELLRSREGREGLRRMLDLLTQHLNWQTAFYRAFQPRFERAIDVEKWWALALVAFTGRDPGQDWSDQLAFRKLDETLQIPMELRRSMAELPERRAASLQQVVSEWDRTQQRLAIQTVIRQLAAIQLKLPGNFASLAEEYRQTLGEFLEERGRSGYAGDRKGDVPLTAPMVARQTVRRLDALDRRRLELTETDAVDHTQP
jgi:hypothetical protein